MMRSIAILMIFDYSSVVFWFSSSELLAQSLMGRSKKVVDAETQNLRKCERLFEVAARFVRLQSWHVSCFLRIAWIRRYGNEMKKGKIGSGSSVCFISRGYALNHLYVTALFHGSGGWIRDLSAVTRQLKTEQSSTSLPWRSLGLTTGLRAATSSSRHPQSQITNGFSAQASSTFPRPELWLAFVTPLKTPSETHMAIPCYFLSLYSDNTTLSTSHRLQLPCLEMPFVYINHDLRFPASSVYLSLSRITRLLGTDHILVAEMHLGG